MATARARVIYQIEVDASDALRKLNNVQKNTAAISKTTKSLNNRLGALGKSLRAALSVALVQQMVQRFTQLSDAATRLNSQLSAAAGGPQAGADALERLFNVAQRLGVPLETLGENFQRLSAAVPSAPVQDVAFALETVSQVLTTTGATVATTNSVLLQLSQGLGTAALQGDEFRSIFEGAPQLLRAWATALGRGGESLTKLRDEQAFTTRSFFELNEEIRRLAEEAIGISTPADTVAKALQRIRNASLFAASQRAGAGQGPFEGLIDVLNQLADSVIPATQVSAANLGVVMENLFEVVEKGVREIVKLATAFDGLADTFLGTKTEFSDVVSDWEELFLVKLPSWIDIAFKAADTARSIFFGAINTAFGTVRELAQGVFDFLTATNPAERRGAFAGVFDTAKEEIASVKASVEDLVGSFEGFNRRRSQIALPRIFGDETENLGIGFESKIFEPPTDSATKSTKAAGAAGKAAERAAKDLARFAEEIRKADEALKALEDQQFDTAQAFTRDFNRGINEQIRALDEELALLRLTGEAQAALSDQFELDAKVRALDTRIIEEQSKALADQNKFLLGNLEAARASLEGGRGQELLDRQARNRNEQRAQEAAQEYEDAFRDTFSGLEDTLRDVFTGNLDAAVTWGERIKNILDDIIGNFVDTLLDETFDALAKNFAQSAISGGGGSSGGGIFGAISQFFGGGGSGAGAVSPVAPPGGGGIAGAAAGGGGFGGFGSLAGFGIGALAGSFFGGAFDSDSGTSLDSPLDPLSDIQGGSPNVNIVNNGVPLRVDSTNRRSNGDLQLVVSSAVAETERMYERNMRRGYGGFAESLNQNTSADRNV
jgi:tape measure domain-containing protein